MIGQIEENNNPRLVIYIGIKINLKLIINIDF